MKVKGISRKVNVTNEVWYLRISEEEVFKVKTITKRERNILNAIRKMMMCHKFSEKDIVLTNRERYIKNVNVSQEKLKRMKANNKFAFAQSEEGK